MNLLKKQILYFDLDNVLVNFQSGIDRIDENLKKQYEGRLDEVPGIFALMEPMPGAVDAFNRLSEVYDTYILSTAPWENPSAWSDKLTWVKTHLGKAAYKRLILTHHKDLNKGDFLIDDRTKNGAGNFEGKLLQFGTPQFPDWKSVVNYLLPKSRPTTYNHIGEILTLDLPLRNDTFLHRVTSENCKAYQETEGYYEDILLQKVEEIETGKFGTLYHDDLYDPRSGWQGNTQCFTFLFEDFDVVVELEDLRIDAEGSFNEVMVHMECSILTDDEEAEIPDYIQALELDDECEYECLEDALDILFTEIGKCKKKYLEDFDME